MATEHYLAIDLGAGSGRVMLGRFDGERIAVDELHRFPNPGVSVLGSLHWDALGLYQQMLGGMQGATSADPVSVGVDTWGVDFALLDAAGQLVGNPFCYRDPRTSGKMAEALEVVSRKQVFECTGLQFMEINTVFQLYAMLGTSALDSARSLLMMPDLFHYWFTGERVCEFTDATTSQCYDPRRRQWAWPVIEGLGLPTGIFGEVVDPGTVLGSLRSAIRDEFGLPAMRVVAPGSHDTASAVAAVPAASGDWAYLSSGTWSLLGVEASEPHVTETVLAKNFTNEGGVERKTRLLKNICGLWLLEECRREWSKDGNVASYEDLIAAAAASKPFRSVIDVDSPGFVRPGRMPARIADACLRTGQPAPETVGQFARAIFEGLALKYRLVLEDLAAITGKRPDVLNIVGGGSQNAMLCQFATDACGIPVVAGPVEATAVGNVLVQAIAAGRIGSLAEGREVVANSYPLARYETNSGSSGLWSDAAGVLRSILPVTQRRG